MPFDFLHRSAAASSTFSVRPHPPDGIPLPFLRKGLRALTRNAGFDVDLRAGTVTWHRERDGAPIALGLPGSGSPRELATVTVVSRVRSDLYRSYIFKRLVLTDAEGRLIDQTTEQEERAFAVVWPDDELYQLTRAQISLTERHVRSRRQLEREFPGTDPHWRWHSQPYVFLIWTGATLALVVTLVLLIGYGVIA